jgi:zinc/manganese transport system substrate-binding protein
VATTSILGDVVSRLVGDDGEVEVLMPAGSDPHSFSPSAAQAATVRDADLVVANGLGLEESLLDLLAAARVEGATVFEVAPELDPIATGGTAVADHDDHAEEDDHADEGDHGEAEGTGDAGDGHGHAVGEADPHVWFDPVRMADGVRLIARELAAVDDTLSDDEWQQRGEDYAAELLALDEEIRETLSVIPAERRVLVTNHEAIGYFAQRYDLAIIGTVVPGGTTLANASASRIAELADTVRDAGVPAIFAENTADARLSEALAREAGTDVEVVQLYTDSLGEEGSGAETYIGLLRTDAQLVADALG